MDEDVLAALTQRMADLGAGDPAGWAESELRENIPQQARYLFLRRVWHDALSPWLNPATLLRYPALTGLLRQGTDEDLLARAVRSVAYETVWAIIGIIDGQPGDEELPDDAPGWALMEADADGILTGRNIDGLHESVMETDPLGRDASDFI